VHTRFTTRAITILLLLAAVAGSTPACAEPVTVYGVGLESCHNYLDTLANDTVRDRVKFVDWLSGFVSGVNRAARHRNNYLGLADLGDGLLRIEHYCQARPHALFAEGAALIVYGARTGPAAHSLEPVNYGAADKTCGQYLEAREERAPANGAEFRDWVAGYLSGVNTISLTTGNVLGGAELLDAVRWLDAWCDAHPLTAFSGAAEALVLQNERAASGSGAEPRVAAQ